MPRLARSARHAPGSLVHVIIRFVDGRFVLDDPARAEYLRLLRRALRRTDWRLISYALMSSHVHLAFLSGATEMAVWAHSLHVRFAQWINRRLRAEQPRALGHVFADRPWAKPRCPSRARFLIGYQHRNPLEAGAAPSVEASTWTSHRAYLGLAPSAGGVDVTLGLELAGFEDSSAGRSAFHGFVAGTSIAVSDLEPMGAPREAVSPLPDARVAPRSELVRRAARLTGVELSEVLRGSRVAPAVLARRVALRAGLELGYTLAELAKPLGVSASGASRLLSRAHDEEPVRTAAMGLLNELSACSNVN